MVEIKKGDGYEIHYDERSQLFSGMIGGQIVVELKTQQEVEDFIKKLAKKGFKRIPVIWRLPSSCRRGAITSVIKTMSGYSGRPSMEVWFVWNDGKRSQREKAYLRDDKFYRETPGNLTIIEVVEELVRERKKLEEEINYNLDRLSDTITSENILILGDWI